MAEIWLGRQFEGFHCPILHSTAWLPSKLVGRYGVFLPLFRLVGVRFIAALRRAKSLLHHRSDRPKLADGSLDPEISAQMFSRGSLFDLILRLSGAGRRRGPDILRTELCGYGRCFKP